MGISLRQIVRRRIPVPGTWPRCTTTWTFPPYQRKGKEAQEQTGGTLNKEHDRKEIGTLTSATALNDYVDWPDVGRGFELERVRALRDKAEVEVVYSIICSR
jgi:ethanolamine ammonia-lyase small subunit